MTKELKTLGYCGRCFNLGMDTNMALMLKCKTTKKDPNQERDNVWRNPGVHLSVCPMLPHPVCPDEPCLGRLAAWHLKSLMSLKPREQGHGDPARRWTTLPVSQAPPWRPGGRPSPLPDTNILTHPPKSN